VGLTLDPGDICQRNFAVYFKNGLVFVTKKRSQNRYLIFFKIVQKMGLTKMTPDPFCKHYSCRSSWQSSQRVFSTFLANGMLVKARRTFWKPVPQEQDHCRSAHDDLSCRQSLCAQHSAVLKDRSLISLFFFSVFSVIRTVLRARRCKRCGGRATSGRH
jgi:hypothetical protein